MKTKQDKPSPEAKALSLFLMAFKNTSPHHKEKSKRINRLWGLVLKDEMSIIDYLEEVENMLTGFGGYTKVIEKTVKFYINKTGEWKLIGNDQYSKDAKEIADEILKTKSSGKKKSSKK